MNADLLITIVIYGVFGYLFGRLGSIIIYKICLFNIIRIFIFLIFPLGMLISFFESSYKGFFIFLILSSEFLKKFYIYTQSYEFQKSKRNISNIIGLIIKPIMFFLHIGMKTGHYAVSVVDGTQSGRKQLQKDKRDFEDQRSWLEDERRKLQEENEKIMKAWEDLIKEREEFERQRDTGNYEKRIIPKIKATKNRNRNMRKKVTMADISKSLKNTTLMTSQKTMQERFWV
jgi:hypothetical protein